MKETSRPLSRPPGDITSMIKYYSMEVRDREADLSAAHEFMDRLGMTATPDAIGQLLEVFVPCLRIICERGYDPDGATWKTAGAMGILTDIRKKFTRLWYQAWHKGETSSPVTDDHPIDMINFLGFYLRAPDRGWGDWGEPASHSDYGPGM